jgi:hypothetical protein
MASAKDAPISPQPTTVTLFQMGSVIAVKIFLHQS